jgi:hypothetical protein
MQPPIHRPIHADDVPIVHPYVPKPKPGPAPTATTTGPVPPPPAPAPVVVPAPPARPVRVDALGGDGLPTRAPSTQARARDLQRTGQASVPRATGIDGPARTRSIDSGARARARRVRDDARRHRHVL